MIPSNAQNSRRVNRTAMGQHRTAKVVIYTTLNCPHCRNVKDWFKQHNIPFLDLNVAHPGKIQRQFFQLGGRQVPLIMIGEQRLVGYNPQQLRKALSLAGLLPSA